MLTGNAHHEPTAGDVEHAKSHGHAISTSSRRFHAGRLFLQRRFGAALSCPHEGRPALCTELASKMSNRKEIATLPRGPRATSLTVLEGLRALCLRKLPGRNLKLPGRGPIGAKLHGQPPRLPKPPCGQPSRTAMPPPPVTGQMVRPVPETNDRHSSARRRGMGTAITPPVK